MVRQLRKFIFAVTGVVILLAITGIAYQSTSERADAERFPQEGKSIDVGGYKLNLNCTGNGEATVVLESGLEVSAIGWRRVQPEIAKFTRVCSYDRAGYGWSDPGPMPRTVSQIATELHTLLKTSGERPPYVLVGHSFGGLIVRMYNGQYSNEVSGILLVDSTHEEWVEKLPLSIKEMLNDDMKRRERQRLFAPILFRLGISRFMSKRLIESRDVPIGIRKTRYLSLQPKFIDATTSEAESFGEDAQLLKTSGTLGDKPLIVLTAGKGILGMPLSTKDLQDAHDLWVDDLQMRLVHLSTRGKRIMISDSGHMIPFERPDAVISAVRDILTSANLH